MDRASLDEMTPLLANTPIRASVLDSARAETAPAATMMMDNAVPANRVRLRVPSLLIAAPLASKPEGKCRRTFAVEQWRDG
jgi:hypothetical protein